MGEGEPRWGMNVETMLDDQWSLGICLSHWLDETYLFVNFFKWTISIGKIMK